MTYIPKFILTETSVDKTVVPNEICVVDTTNGPVTITLLQSSPKGSECKIIDKGNASKNNITIVSDMIIGVSSSAVIDVDHGIGTFTRLDGGTFGWIYDNTGY